MKLLIKNANIINADTSSESDILCENGLITKIESNLSIDGVTETIDASDCYVFPGGIDPHVHMHLPSPAGFSSDDFFSGSRAAVHGGTTTIIDFVTPKKGESLLVALQKRKQEAAESLIDYSFHVSPIEWTINTEEEIKQCMAEGVTSFKVYMAYKKSIGLKDSDILKVMRVVGKAGGIVTAHCELGDEIEALRDSFANEGKLSPEYHPLSRPNELEAKAVKRFIDMAKSADCPIYVVHVSAKESIQYIQKAQENGQKVYAETCPQYLLLDESKYLGAFEMVVPFVMSPPLRKKTNNKALWEALGSGILQTLGTDHCPFSLAQKSFGKDDFRKIPNGAGGVEHRLALLYTYGVLQNKLSLNQFVDIVSTQAAKIFGLYPQKGVIQEGADADLVIWNPTVENQISKSTHHQNCDTNIYEGVNTKGYPKYVIINGEIVKSEARIINDRRVASFLKRKTQ